MNRPPRPLSFRSALRAGLPLVLVAAVAGCGKKGEAKGPDAPSADGSGTAGSGADGSGTGGGTTAAAGHGRKVFPLTPEAFAAEFKAGPEATKEKYDGGDVELTGVVEEIGIDITGKGMVSLRAGPPVPASANGPASVPVVDCTTTDPEPWATVARGQQATVRGRVGALPMAPNLTKCTATAAGPATVVTVAPAALATEYAAGADAFRAKYAGKDLVVAGTVVDRKVDATQAVTLTLDVGGPARVRCAFGMVESINRPYAAAVKVGQPVKVFGSVAAKKPYDPPPTADAPLDDCHLISK